MVKDFLGTGPFMVVLQRHEFDNANAFLTDSLPYFIYNKKKRTIELNLSLDNLVHNFLDVIAFEGNFTTYQMIHGDSDCPDIHLFGIFLINDFWCHVGWGSDSGREQFIRLYFCRYSKVDQLYVVRVTFFEQDILGFYVPVNDSHVMEIHYSSQQLFNYESDKLLLLFPSVCSFDVF